jgi:hypothetical protein
MLWSAPLFVATASIGAYGQPDVERYELSERCGKRAFADFQRNFGSGVRETRELLVRSWFRHHYNARLNRCFYLIASFSYKRSNAHSNVNTDIALLDLDGNREYGTFWKSTDSSLALCSIFVKQEDCTSEAEWEAFVQSYMENED